MSSFDDAFTNLIGNEGGYSDDPNDPGGKTRWGVTERVARAHGYTGDMKDYPLEDAKVVAKKLYWDPYGCDAFHPDIGFQILDAAYNGGHVVLWMQQAAGVKADGAIGPHTLAAVRTADPKAWTMKFLAARLTYLTLTKPWPHEGAGWAHRIANNLRKGAA